MTIMVDLSRRFTYGGKNYGPGETEVPDSVRKAENLSAAFRKELEGEGSVDPFTPDSTNDPTLTREEDPSGETLSGFAGLSDEVVQELNARGYNTKDDLRGASDEELDAVPGIGTGRIASIREALAVEDDSEGRPEQQAQ